MNFQRFLCLALASGFAVHSARAVESKASLPGAWPASRFENLIQRSPFAPATPPVAPVVTANFASSLYVSSIAAIGDKYLVTISSREQPNKIFLATGEEGADGLTLVGVEYSDESGKSKAVVKKGDETATLEFDQAAIQQGAAQAAAQAAAPVPAAPRPWDPSQAGRPSAGVRPRGNVPPPVPGPGHPVRTLPQQGYLQQNQPPGTTAPQTRRRIRIINSKPGQ
jgi:hypothetical protein